MTSSRARRLPAAYRDSAQAKPAVDIGWRDFFADARLQRMIEIALKNNRDLRVSVLNMQASQAQYRIVRAGAVPDARRRRRRKETAHAERSVVPPA